MNEINDACDHISIVFIGGNKTQCRDCLKVWESFIDPAYPADEPSAEEDDDWCRGSMRAGMRAYERSQRR